MTSEPQPQWSIRPGRDSDGPALIALIWACWSAYPGIRMDVNLEMPELHALASYYANNGGALWVAETGSAVSGIIAVRPLQQSAWEICRVYVAPALHGSGLGHALLDRAERHAIAAGATHLSLWSDTRFDRAHRFYEKRSYVRQGPVRVLNDISNSLEFGYGKPVDGITALDIAAATSAVDRLTGILNACTGDCEARAFWQRAASDVGAGKRLILAAWRDGIMVGAGMLSLEMPRTQRHRAEVQQLLVHPSARRRGAGRQLLRAAEHHAGALGRSLLSLRTRAGGAEEAFYRAENWQEAGRIPGFTRDPNGMPHAAIFFWKQIASG